MTFPTPSLSRHSSTSANSRLPQTSDGDSANALLATKGFSQRNPRRKLESELERTITSPRSAGKTRSGLSFCPPGTPTTGTDPEILEAETSNSASDPKGGKTKRDSVVSELETVTTPPRAPGFQKKKPAKVLRDFHEVAEWMEMYLHKHML